MTSCPTCGCPCHVIKSDEGTASYVRGAYLADHSEAVRAERERIRGIVEIAGRIVVSPSNDDDLNDAFDLVRRGICSAIIKRIDA